MVEEEVAVEQLPILVVFQRLPQRPADPVCRGAVHLTLDDHRVDPGAAVVDDRVIEDLHFSRFLIYFHDRDMCLGGVGQREVAKLALHVRYLERGYVDVATRQRQSLRHLQGEDGVIGVHDVGDVHERHLSFLVACYACHTCGEHDLVLVGFEGECSDLDDLGAQFFGGSDHCIDSGDGELAGVGTREANVCAVCLVEAGRDAYVLRATAEDVRSHLGGGCLVALSLGCRTQGERHLPVQVQLRRARLAVPRERQLWIQNLRLAEVVGTGVDGRADPDADALAGADGGFPHRLGAFVIDQVEHLVECQRKVPRVVDATVWCLVRVVLWLYVVFLAELDRVEAELVGHDVDDALGQPHVLHP